MRCNNCKAEWNVSAAMSASIKTCPFCGADIAPKPDGEVNSLQDVLKAIIAHGGLNSLRNGGRSLAMFSDLAPKLRKERTLYSYLVQCEGNVVLLDVLNKSRPEQLAARGKLMQQMVDDLLLSEAVARQACNSFWQAIGGKEFDDTTRSEISPSSVEPTFGEKIRKADFFDSNSSTKKSEIQIERTSNVDKKYLYSQALAIYATALTETDFNDSKSIFLSLNTYENSTEMAATISAVLEERKRYAHEVFQAYQYFISEAEIATLEKKKADLLTVQKSFPQMNDRLHCLNKERIELASQLDSISQQIAKVSTHKTLLGMLGPKEQTAKLMNLQKEKEQIDRIYQSVCGQIESLSGKLKSAASPETLKEDIRNIELRISEKECLLQASIKPQNNSSFTNLANVCRLLMNWKVLAILAADEAKRAKLLENEYIRKEIIRMEQSGVRFVGKKITEYLRELPSTEILYHLPQKGKGVHYALWLTCTDDLPDDYSFDSTSGVEVLVIKNIKNIPDRAFANCSDLRYVFFDQSLETMGSEVFAGCPNLVYIIFSGRNAKRQFASDAFTYQQKEIMACFMNDSYIRNYASRYHIQLLDNQWGDPIPWNLDCFWKYGLHTT